MMVGFEGPLTDSVKADWKGRQFGGLLVVNLNHNGDSARALTSVIASLRGLSRHRLVAATDQEGGQVCLAVSSLPCAAMPVGQAEMTNMSAGIKALGFDLNLAPVSDVCSGSSSIMWGRCYGTDPGSVAQAVGSAVDGIRAARVLSAAKHFPGHGNTAVSSETQLPRIDESAQIRLGTYRHLGPRSRTEPTSSFWAISSIRLSTRSAPPICLRRR